MNDDIISRSGAVALILSGKVGDDSLVECPEECNSFLDWAAEEVGKMPSAERKKGKWLPENRTIDAFWVCSSCGFPSEAHAANILYKFCPNCGCRMTEGEQDE